MKKRFISRIISGIISTAVLIPMSAQATNYNIDIDEYNKLTIVATDIKDYDTISWSANRYRCEVEGADYTGGTGDGFYDFLVIVPTANEVKITLIPTGKFRENTEVDIFGQYFLMAETDINGEDIIKGDINFDGRINIADAVLLQRYILGTTRLDRMPYHRADMDRDGVVDVFDMVLMRKKIINTIMEDNNEIH